MNKELGFLFISLTFVCVIIISICTAPIINYNNEIFSKWGKQNCLFFRDQEENSKHIDELQKFRKLKNLCYRQKTMYNLEYSSLIIDIVLGLITTQLGFLLYFKVGGPIDKISGIFAIITGIISLILTLIYISYSGYIFNNDIAYKKLEPDNSINGYASIPESSKKLFSNGAYVKMTGDSVPKITQVFPYQDEAGEEIEYIKYKDLGKIEYNYNKRYYEAYYQLSNCKEFVAANTNNCDYFFLNPTNTVTNKYLYDNWITRLVFSCCIVAFSIGLLIFGILVCKNKGESDLLIPNSENIEINKKS